jgi:CYTH domain-containing protein/CHAD domain-containing protein
MSTAHSFCDLPAAIVARHLLLAHLQSAEAANARLQRTDEAEAFDDFRQALRRLRICLRHFGRLLADVVNDKDARRLRKLYARLAPARGSEAQITWLRAEMDTLQAAGGLDVGWIAELLEQQMAGAISHPPASLDRSFRKLHKRLQKKLSGFQLAIEADRPPSLPSCRTVVPVLAERLITRLERQLAAVGGYRDQAQANRARVTAERIAELLGPFRDETPGLDTALSHLDELQELLADLRDVNGLGAAVFHLLESLPEDDPRVPDVHFLLRRLHQRQALVFGELQASWLGNGAARGLHGLRELMLMMGASGAASADLEIERKFLLAEFPPLPVEAEVEVLEVEQGWLPGVRLLERLRRVRTPDGERYYRAIKLGSGLTRIEIEESLDRPLFESLWALTEGRRVFKTRYRVRSDGVLWEIDRFSDRELVLAEVELPSAETQVELPSWLAAPLVREVTDEPQYLNVNLAR